jgi:hypothetical protein
MLKYFKFGAIKDKCIETGMHILKQLSEDCESSLVSDS